MSKTFTHTVEEARDIIYYKQELVGMLQMQRLLY